MVNKKRRMKMKKYIQSMMAFAAIVSFASCSSEDNVTNEMESEAKVMTFTATQDGDETNTKAVLATNGTSINWETNDRISLFDGTKNNEFKLKEGNGSTSATFEGTAATATTYTAVYPYTSTASLSGNDVANVTLPATQTATANSFDKSAALMMAQSTSTSLVFKNVVGYVKVTPTFDCSKIELKAADETAPLAGTGTLSYNGAEPKLDLSSAENKSYTITLSGNIVANNDYYIAVPAVTLSAGWSIAFTNTDDTKVFTRKGTKQIQFTRNKILSLGNFSKSDATWTSLIESNGTVKASQQVDLGLTIQQNGNTYRVIFAKSNLTSAGLAEKETDYGDYFSWGATEPWYDSYSFNGTSISVSSWKSTYTDGYTQASYDNYINGRTIEDNNILT